MAIERCCLHRSPLARSVASGSSFSFNFGSGIRLHATICVTYVIVTENCLPLVGNVARSDAADGGSECDASWLRKRLLEFT